MDLYVTVPVFMSGMTGVVRITRPFMLTSLSMSFEFSQLLTVYRLVRE